MLISFCLCCFFSGWCCCVCSLECVSSVLVKLSCLLPVAIVFAFDSLLGCLGSLVLRYLLVVLRFVCCFVFLRVVVINSVVVCVYEFDYLV